MFTEELPWLGARDKEWIMGRALCEWLEWCTTNVGRAAPSVLTAALTPMDGG